MLTCKWDWIVFFVFFCRSRLEMLRFVWSFWYGVRQHVLCLFVCFDCCCFMFFVLSRFKTRREGLIIKIDDWEFIDHLVMQQNSRLDFLYLIPFVSYFIFPLIVPQQFHLTLLCCDALNIINPPKKHFQFHSILKFTHLKFFSIFNVSFSHSSVILNYYYTRIVL